MQLTIVHNHTTYTVETKEHIEHAFEFDGEVSTPCTELFYAYHIKGGEHHCSSFDVEDGYQIWPTEWEAIDAGVKALMHELRQDYQEKEAA